MYLSPIRVDSLMGLLYLYVQVSQDKTNTIPPAAPLPNVCVHLFILCRRINNSI